MVEFEIPEAYIAGAAAEAIPLEVVYEDDDLLVVDKAAGMVTHPAHGATDGTAL